MPDDGFFAGTWGNGDRNGYPSAGNANFSGNQWQEDQHRLHGTAGIVPTNLASWVTSVLLQGEKGAKLVRCMESPIFIEICAQIRKRTGLNTQWIIAAALAINSAKDAIPIVFQEALHQVKKQVTSSITLGSNDSDLHNGLLRFVRNSGVGSNESWLSLSGRHEQRDSGGELRPLAGDMKQVFWWKDVLFVLDRGSEEINIDDQDDEIPQDWNCTIPNKPKTEPKMTIRCFGHSNEPIVALIEHIKMEAKQSEQLQVLKKGAENDDNEIRDKRPLSSIDMEPKMYRQVLQEVNDFFHLDSKRLYKDTSRPYRHGFLFHGPPGTGKTSLSVAIASHIGVTLVIINMQGMDDKDLEHAFSSAPLPCVILLEDIDACSADVSHRGSHKQTKQKKPEQQHQPIEQAEVVGIIENTLSGFNKEITQLRKEQETSMGQIFRFMKEHVAQAGANQFARNNQKNPVVPQQPPPPKRVTLSGLLNVIDGASAIESRLLIMTTNHPEKLDPALTRAGRCDSKFHLGYATKNSAERTFKRIFGADSCKRHQSEAIDRFAKAFKQQFPSNSRIPTCDLARYCGLYRNRPVEAIKDFAEWLVKGDELFVYSIASQNTDEMNVNVAEAFDVKLLEVSPEDLVPVAIEEHVTHGTRVVQRSIFNPLRYITGSTRVVQQQLLTELDANETAFSLEDVEYDEWPFDWPSHSFFDRFRSPAPLSPEELEWPLPGIPSHGPKKSYANVTQSGVSSSYYTEPARNGARNKREEGLTTKVQPLVSLDSVDFDEDEEVDLLEDGFPGGKREFWVSRRKQKGRRRATNRKANGRKVGEKAGPKE
jgi:chaperone BCS1